MTLEDFKSTITASTKDSFELHFPLPGDPGIPVWGFHGQPWQVARKTRLETALGKQMLVVSGVEGPEFTIVLASIRI